MSLPSPPLSIPSETHSMSQYKTRPNSVPKPLELVPLPIPDAILSARVDVLKPTDNVSATSALIQPAATDPNLEPPLPPRHREVAQNRALATWLSIMLIREKLKFEHIDIEFDETDMRYQLIYILTKSFHLIDPPTPAIFMAFLYLCRVFPDGIPYSGDPDVECATALHRLFLFCLRLVLQWCEDDALHYDFRGRFFLWHEHIGLEKPVFRTAEVNLMYLLDHNLCISNVVYARWMSDLRALLPAFLAGNYYQEERSAIEDLIECAFPPLTPEFLDPGTLPCNGYPLDEDWQPQTRTLHEFRQRGRDLIDSLTFGVAIPLYQALDAPFIEGEGDFEDHESFLDPFHSSKVLGSPSDDLYTHSETSGSESSSDDLYTHSETSGSDSSPCGRLLMDSSSPAESETDSLEETLQYLSNLEAKQLQPQIPPFPFPASLLSIAPPEWIESSLRLLGLC